MMVSKGKICLIIFIIFLAILLIPISILSYYYFYTDTVDCRCKLGSNVKIIRGIEASENFIPYQVSISFEDEHICSGVLINSHFILTAAHCIDNLSIWKLKIRVGISKLNSTDIDKTYRVIRSFIHSSYNRSIERNENDIALLRTFFPIKFEHKITDSACLNLDEKKNYSTLIATGFGCYKSKISKKTNRCKQSNSLRYAEYEETSNCEEDCEMNSENDCKKYCESIIIANPISDQSLCTGDSGGPISVTRNGNTTVEGIASYVFSGSKNMPYGRQKINCAGKTIFARLSSNKLFIEEIIGNNYCGNLN